MHPIGIVVDFCNSFEQNGTRIELTDRYCVDGVEAFSFAFLKAEVKLSLKKKLRPLAGAQTRGPTATAQGPLLGAA